LTGYAPAQPRMPEPALATGNPGPRASQVVQHGAPRSAPRARRDHREHRPEMWLTRGSACVVRPSAARDSKSQPRYQPCRAHQLPASGRPPGKPSHHGDHHAPVPHESPPRRHATGRRASPPSPGGTAGPRAAPLAREPRRTSQAPCPAAISPSDRLAQQARCAGRPHVRKLQASQRVYRALVGITSRRDHGAAAEQTSPPPAPNRQYEHLRRCAILKAGAQIFGRAAAGWQGLRTARANEASHPRGGQGRRPACAGEYLRHPLCRPRSRHCRSLASPPGLPALLRPRA
jgi:hypothetical protein